MVVFSTYKHGKHNDEKYVQKQQVLQLSIFANLNKPTLFIFLM